MLCACIREHSVEEFVGLPSTYARNRSRKDVRYARRPLASSSSASVFSMSSIFSPLDSPWTGWGTSACPPQTGRTAWSSSFRGDHVHCTWACAQTRTGTTSSIRRVSNRCEVCFARRVFPPTGTTRACSQSPACAPGPDDPTKHDPPWHGT